MIRVNLWLLFSFASYVRKGSKVRFSLALLATILVLLGSGNLSHGQEAAGGSIKDFKRPANPPVYGGRIPKGHKSSTGSKSDAVEPTKPKAEEPRSTTTGFGGLGSSPKRSGAGGATATPTSSAAPADARPAPRPLPARSAGEVNEELEEAIAAGNDARDRKPPDYEKAEQAYRLAAKIDPKAVRAYEGLGNIFIDQKKYAEAFAAFQQAVSSGARIRKCLKISAMRTSRWDVIRNRWKRATDPSH